jgi:hypothetical protein
MEPKMAVERETIVTDSGTGAGGLVVAVIAMAAIVFVALWLGNGLRVGPAGNTIDVDVPAVTVTPDGQ